MSDDLMSSKFRRGLTLIKAHARTRTGTRSLPVRMQWAIVGLMSAAVIFIGAMIAMINIVLSSSHAAGSPLPVAPAGTFLATQAQLAGLRMATATKAIFRNEEITDGKIALDGDLTTAVFSPFSGRVTRVIVNPGDVVKQGQALFALEASEFIQGQNDLVAATGVLNAARVARDNAKKIEARQHELFDAKAGAQKDWEQSRSDLATAEATLQSAQVALGLSQNKLRILGKTDRDIAALASAGKISPETIVTSPISGTVMDRQIGPGQYIQSGSSTPQYTIGDLSTVWLVANIREADAPVVQLGQAVEVRALAYPGRIFKAKITYIAAAVDPNTRRIPVRAAIENNDGALKPEMFASFTIISGEAANAVGVPEASVIYEGESARVWVLRDGGAIELRQVHTGRSSNKMVEIVSGLTPGEKIVTSGALFIDRAVTAD